MNLAVYTLLILFPLLPFNGIKVNEFIVESTFKGEHVAKITFGKDGKFRTSEVFQEVQVPNCVGTGAKKDTRKIFRNLKITLRDVSLVQLEKSQIRNNPAFIELYSEDQFWMVLNDEDGKQYAPEDVGSYLKLKEFSKSFIKDFKNVYDLAEKECK